MRKYKTGRPAGGISEDRIPPISAPFYPYCRCGAICHPLHLRYITGADLPYLALTQSELEMASQPYDFWRYGYSFRHLPCWPIDLSYHFAHTLVKWAGVIQLLLLQIVDLHFPGISCMGGNYNVQDG